MQIYRNKGARKKASRKTVYDKDFKVLAKKVTFIKKLVVPLKQSISHGECLVHDKEKFLF